MDKLQAQPAIREEPWEASLVGTVLGQGLHPNQPQSPPQERNRTVLFPGSASTLCCRKSQEAVWSWVHGTPRAPPPPRPPSLGTVSAQFRGKLTGLAPNRAWDGGPPPSPRAWSWGSLEPSDFLGLPRWQNAGPHLFTAPPAAGGLCTNARRVSLL